VNSFEPFSEDPARGVEYVDYDPLHPGFSGSTEIMPSPVRRARILAWCLAVLGIALVAIAIATGNRDLAGAIAFSWLFAWLLALVAVAFTMDGRTVQVVGVALAALSAFLCLGLMAVGPLPGLAGLGLSIAVVVLLCKGQSSAWFGRHRH
jgi:hypothetical protein